MTHSKNPICPSFDGKFFVCTYLLQNPVTSTVCMPLVLSILVSIILLPNCSFITWLDSENPYYPDYTISTKSMQTFKVPQFCNYSKALRYAVFGSRKKPCSSKPHFMRFISMYWRGFFFKKQCNFKASVYLKVTVM